MHEINSQDAKDYGAYLSEGTVAVQRCMHCSRMRHYPQPMCPHCHGMEFEWRRIEGVGIVHSWTVCHASTVPGFENKTPYTLVTVDLPEGVRVLALWGAQHGAPEVGMSLTLSFIHASEATSQIVCKPV